MATQFGGFKYALFSKTADNYTIQGQTFHHERHNQAFLTNEEDDIKKYAHNGNVVIKKNPEHLKTELQEAAAQKTDGLMKMLQQKFGNKLSPEDASEISTELGKSVEAFADDVRASGVDPDDMDIKQMLLASLTIDDETEAKPAGTPKAPKAEKQDKPAGTPKATKETDPPAEPKAKE